MTYGESHGPAIGVVIEGVLHLLVPCVQLADGLAGGRLEGAHRCVEDTLHVRHVHRVARRLLQATHLAKGEQADVSRVLPSLSEEDDDVLVAG